MATTKGTRMANEPRDRKTFNQERVNPTHPLPPLNLHVLYGFDSTLNAYDIRWDNPQNLPGNSQWNILGVNVYRSHDSEFGPYHRINTYPLGTTFFRDETINDLVEDEDVSNQFLSKGTEDEANQWIFQVSKYPIVKENSEAIPAEHPLDVIVKIDGVEVIPKAVYGITGGVELSTQKLTDPATNKLVDPVLPKPNSVVTCTYRYSLNLIPNYLNRKVFYRVTSVGQRSWDDQLQETPLEWTEPITVHHLESMDYIWREAIHRNSWILDQGGERVWVFIRKYTGETCKECYDVDYSQPRNDCEVCYGTGIVGAYEGPFEMKIAPQDADKKISWQLEGLKLEHTYEVWGGPSPMLSQRDFLVKQNNERYSIGPVRMPTNRGNILQQHFALELLEHTDIRYKFPVYGTHDLTYPETRYVDWDDPRTNQPVNPQITDEKTPDEIEVRGRTPTYGNINS